MNSSHRRKLCLDKDTNLGWHAPRAELFNVLQLAARRHLPLKASEDTVIWGGGGGYVGVFFRLLLSIADSLKINP